MNFKASQTHVVHSTAGCTSKFCEFVRGRRIYEVWSQSTNRPLIARPSDKIRIKLNLHPYPYRCQVYEHYCFVLQPTPPKDVTTQYSIHSLIRQHTLASTTYWYCCVRLKH